MGAVIRLAVTGWALIGGVILMFLAALTCASVLLDLATGRPLAGGFEAVELGIAVAAFSFLPYAQMTGAHATADLFTAKAGPRLQASASLASSLLAVCIAAILLWRMSLGMIDYRADGETTAILGVPVWIAFPPILVSLALLALAAAMGVRDGLRDLRRA